MMILNRQRRIHLAVKPLTRFCERVGRELGFPEESVTICFVSDPAIARMNRKFRNKQGPTDVLSFPARRAKGRTNGRFPPIRGVRLGRYVGDIVISPETARRYARRRAGSLASELRVLILHGMIHLAGYDHERDDGEMVRLEVRLRRRLGLR
jgi:probable rRNA maturation factor